MGPAADLLARDHGVSRRAQDEYAARSHARAAATQGGPRSAAATLAELLLAESAECRELWQAHEVGLQTGEVKRFGHPQVGRLDLTCQTLVDPSQSHLLLVYTATPGTESYERLQLLSVVATR